MTIKEKGNLAHFALSMEHSIETRAIETEAGYCLRAVRQGWGIAFPGEKWPVPQGSDAGQALKWFIDHGYALAAGNLGLPGDIYFWVGPGHGRHGHVEVRLFDNRTGGNSSIHVAGADRNALGFRAMTTRNRPTRVVRFVPKR